MARDLNSVTILGNLGSDPEKRHLQSGKSVCNLRIATNERWTDRDGKPQESVEWHTVVVFDKAADFAAEYLRKGSRVLVQGKLQTRKWTDKNGVERYSTEIVAFPSGLSSQDKREEDEDERPSRDNRRAPREDNNGAHRTGGGQRQTRSAQEDLDDEIPFGDTRDESELDAIFKIRRGG